MTNQTAPESQCEPWLVLRTRSHHQNIVESALQQKQINVYLPRQRVVRRRKDRLVINAYLVSSGVSVEVDSDKMAIL